jgi:hypothetical protein
MQPVNPSHRWSWLVAWFQARRRKRTLEVRIELSSDGHGRLTWLRTEPSPGQYLICYSADGTSFNDAYDGTSGGATTYDASGVPGYFRVVLANEDDGSPEPPYSNVVFSDGL